LDNTDVLCALVYNNEPGFGLSVGFWISEDLGLDLNFHPNYFLGWIWVLGLGYGFGCPHTTSIPNPTHCHPYSSHPPLTDVMTERPCERLHMDLVGPSCVRSVGLRSFA
jgi:hypothetical protein